jgi:hypothetical protein
VETEFTALLAQYQTIKTSYEDAKDLKERPRLLDEMNALPHEVPYRYFQELE